MEKKRGEEETPNQVKSSGWGQRKKWGGKKEKQTRSEQCPYQG